MGGDHRCRKCVYYWTLPVEYDPTVWDPTHHCYRDCYQCLWVSCGELCDEGLAVVFDSGKQKQRCLLGGFMQMKGMWKMKRGKEKIKQPIRTPSIHLSTPD